MPLPLLALTQATPRPRDWHNHDRLMVDFDPGPTLALTSCSSHHQGCFLRWFSHPPQSFGAFSAADEPPPARSTTQITFPRRGRTFMTNHDHHGGSNGHRRCCYNRRPFSPFPIVFQPSGSRAPSITSANTSASTPSINREWW